MILRDLLENLFKPAKILLLGSDNSGTVQFEDLVRKKYDCEIDRGFTGVISGKRYDLIVVGLSETEAIEDETIKALHATGTPIVLLRSEEDIARVPKLGLVLLMPSHLTEGDVDNMFWLFKIKARTSDMNVALESPAPMPEAELAMAGH